MEIERHVPSEGFYGLIDYSVGLDRGVVTMQIKRFSIAIFVNDLCSLSVYGSCFKTFKNLNCESIFESVVPILDFSIHILFH